MNTNQPFDPAQGKPVSASSPVETAPRMNGQLTPRVSVSLAVTFLGFMIFTIGTKPDWFGWDRSSAVGFVQIAVFLAGLAFICLGGYIGLLILWRGHERTILSEIGTRLVSTGYVIAVFAGMADVFGMGSQPSPQVPYFGPWQASGVLIGQGIIALGFLLFIPFHPRKTSRNHN